MTGDVTYYSLVEMEKGSSVWRRYLRRYSGKIFKARAQSPLKVLPRIKAHARLVNNIDKIAPYPRCLTLVVANVCNLQCIMCPYHSPVSQLVEFREKNDYYHHTELMGRDLLTKLIDEVSDWPIRPFVKIGTIEEPFLHPEVDDFIHIIKQKGLYLRFTTNGTILDRHIEALIKNEVDRVTVSLDALTPETYKYIRGGDLKSITDNIEKLLEVRKANGTKKPELFVSLGLQERAIEEAEEFARYWRQRVDGVDLYHILKLKNGIYDYETYFFPPPTTRVVCASGWYEVAVMPDGDVTTCCQALRLLGNRPSSDFSVGNAKKQSLSEIWRGAKYSGFRHSLIDEDWSSAPQCEGCPAWAEWYTTERRESQFLVEEGPYIRIQRKING